jgi:hypothetical protein
MLFKPLFITFSFPTFKQFMHEKLKPNIDIVYIISA